MYKPFGSALKSLCREFRRGAYIYSPVFHELIIPWNETYSFPKPTWEAFISAQRHRVHSSWELFDISPNLRSCSRFIGSEAGVEEFKRLGESLYLVLSEMDHSLERGRGYHGLIDVLYDMAYAFPTPLLRIKNEIGIWGKTFQPAPTGSSEEAAVAAIEWWEENTANWTTPEDGSEPYPTNPYFQGLVHNIFTSVVSAIQCILDPDSALLVGDQNSDFPFALLRGPRLTKTSEDASKCDDDKGKVGDFDIQKQDDKQLPAKMESVEVGHTECHFQRRGKKWFLRFSLEQDAFENLKGFSYLATLLAQPERHIEAVVLEGRQDCPVVDETMKPQFALDRKARKDTEKLIAELEQEVAQKENVGESATELKAQLEKAKAYLREGTQRRLGAPSPREQARKAVSRAIKRAIDQIRVLMPECAKFLDRSILPNGTAWRYSPATPSPKWVLEP